MTRWVQVSQVQDPDLQAAARARVDASIAADRARLGGPVAPVEPRLLCGCVVPPVGPSPVLPDGSCAVCSRRGAR